MRIMTVAFALGTALVLCNWGRLVSQRMRRRPKSFVNHGKPTSGARGKDNSLLGLLYCSTIYRPPFSP